MKYLMAILVAFSLTGCVTPMLNSHESYCNTYSEAQRTAFRVLTGNTVTINCEQYIK